MCAEQRAGFAFTLEKQILFERQCLCFQGVADLGMGFPGKAACVQRDHQLGVTVPKSCRPGCKSGTNLAPVPWEVPACGPGSSGISGSFVFVASLQLTLMEVPDMELLEQRRRNDCKQHPNKRTCRLASAQYLNIHS